MSAKEAEVIQRRLQHAEKEILQVMATTAPESPDADHLHQLKIAVWKAIDLCQFPPAPERVS